MTEPTILLTSIFGPNIICLMANTKELIRKNSNTNILAIYITCDEIKKLSKDKEKLAAAKPRPNRNQRRSSIKLQTPITIVKVNAKLTMIEALSGKNICAIGDRIKNASKAANRYMKLACLKEEFLTGVDSIVS